MIIADVLFVGAFIAVATLTSLRWHRSSAPYTSSSGSVVELDEKGRRGSSKIHAVKFNYNLAF